MKLINKELEEAGINLQAVFDLASLPSSITSTLKALFPDFSNYRQLILFAHAGRRMWQQVKPTLSSTNEAIDSYSRHVVSRFCNHHLEGKAFRLIYPSNHPVGLQSLGKLAGWHHDSPFRIGINQQWGSWFAYRAAVLADSNFEPTSKQQGPSPCTDCASKPCITACPAKALENDFSLQACLDYRKRPDSQCKDRCLARMTCPVAKQHQYTLEQINYHYGISMKMIEDHSL